MQYQILLTAIILCLFGFLLYFNSKASAKIEDFTDCGCNKTLINQITPIYGFNSLSWYRPWNSNWNSWVRY